MNDGFFLRAETFFNFATYLEEVGSTYRAYGGKPLNEQSRGEAFLALFHNRFKDEFTCSTNPKRRYRRRGSSRFCESCTTSASAREHS